MQFAQTPSRLFCDMFLALKHTTFDIYKLCLQLLIECYVLANRLPKSEIFNLIQQIRRAAVSVRLNIAEGSSRKSPAERKRFYEIARGSLIEIDCAIDICVSLKYLTAEEVQKAGSLIIRCYGMISKMILKNELT